MFDVNLPKYPQQQATPQCVAALCGSAAPVNVTPSLMHVLKSCFALIGCRYNCPLKVQSVGCGQNFSLKHKKI